MNENGLYVVEEYKFDNSLITDIDSLIDSSFKDTHSNYCHKIRYECIYEIELKIITNNEIISLTISDKSMNLYDLSKKLKVTGQNAIIFHQINKLTIKFFFALTISEISNTDVS